MPSLNAPTIIIARTIIIACTIIITRTIVVATHNSTRHCVTHQGLKQLCTSYSLELSEYFFDRLVTFIPLIVRSIIITI